jgi:hypothetical protein
MEGFFGDLERWLREGFDQVNGLQLALIAIGGAYLLASWGGVFIMAAGATFVHVIVDALYPVLVDKAEFQMPAFNDAYWKYLFALYVGYVAVITVFYIAKRMLMGARHSAHA